MSKPRRTLAIVAVIIIGCLLIFFIWFKPKPVQISNGSCFQIDGEWGQFIFKIDTYDSKLVTYFGSFVGEGRPSQNFYESENGIFHYKHSTEKIGIPATLLEEYRSKKSVPCSAQ